ncbi:MAG: FkbM family methyltransferase, partial [Bacteroidota bacterium]
MKQLIKQLLNTFGLDIIKLNTKGIGRMDLLLGRLKDLGLTCNSIFDVGANKGHWSLMAKTYYPDSNFVLIEPLEELSADLKRFCDQNENSRYFMVGVGSKEDVLTLTIWDDLAGSSFLPKADQDLLNSGKQRPITIKTIDGLIKEHNLSIPELIKLDIQGFELEALKGATSLFGKTEVFILEVSMFKPDDLPEAP